MVEIDARRGVRRVAAVSRQVRGERRGPVHLRLTRRGRLVALALLLGLAVLLTGLAATPGQAADPPAAPRTAVVQPGDTLWSIAERYAPGRDPYRAVDQLRRSNGIADYTVHPGQRLNLPWP